MAACPTLLAVSCANTLERTVSMRVFSMPDLRYLHTLGAAVVFPGGTEEDYYHRHPDTRDLHGGAAFTLADLPLLLVVDDHNKSVHVVDALARAHVGHVGPAGGFVCPASVAATATMVAVSEVTRVRGPCVSLFEGGGAAWTLLRRVGEFDDPLIRKAVRFSMDGSALAIATSRGAALFSAADGRSLGCPQQVYLRDLWSCGPDAWLLSQGDVVVSVGLGGHGSPTAVEALVGRRNPGSRRNCPWEEEGEGEEYFHSVTVIPGLGVLVSGWRCHARTGNCLGPGFVKLRSTPDMMAQAAMSGLRVAWMGAVARMVAARRAAKARTQCAVAVAVAESAPVRRLRRRVGPK